jgi:hypothetical protein
LMSMCIVALCDKALDFTNIASPDGANAWGWISMVPIWIERLIMLMVHRLMAWECTVISSVSIMMI